MVMPDVQGPPEPLWLCPVCGFDGFDEPTWYPDGEGSLEICPSCGVQFGYTDAAGGSHERRRELWAERRQKWIDEGCNWKSEGWGPPPGWDPQEQLRNLEKVQL